MKTLDGLAFEYCLKKDLWLRIAEDPQALEDRGKTKQEALWLANYFEGKCDGVAEAKYHIEK